MCASSSALLSAVARPASIEAGSPGGFDEASNVVRAERPSLAHAGRTSDAKKQAKEALQDGQNMRATTFLECLQVFDQRSTLTVGKCACKRTPPVVVSVQRGAVRHAPFNRVVVDGRGRGDAIAEDIDDHLGARAMLLCLRGSGVAHQDASGFDAVSSHSSCE